MTSPASNRVTSASRESGAALLAAMITLTVLTAIAATVFMSSVPAYRGTYQAAAWHEAKMAADAGVDFAIATLQKTTPNPALYDWAGWTLEDGTAVPKGFDGVRIYTPPADTLVNAGDGSTRPRVVRVEIDVVTRDDNFSQNAWYRIRSTGLAEIPSSQLSLDKRDLTLRRMTLKKNHVSRTFEVMSRPVYLWEYALKTDGSMILGGGTSWKIDSYDSRYPGQTSTATGIYSDTYSRKYGNVASNMTRPANDEYGMLIDAEGAVVKGEVQTNGGDDPNTQTHENVEESDGIDQNRITDEYSEKLTPELTPDWALKGQAPEKYEGTPKTGTVTSGSGMDDGGSVESPHRVIITANGNQPVGGFEVTNSTPGSDRFVDIYVNGNVDLNGNTIQVEKGVHVNIFLNGDLNFRNMDINYGKDTKQDPTFVKDHSMRPADLLIFGVKDKSSTPAPKVESAGNGHIVAAFYGPQYAGHLDGNTEIMGSFVLKTYDISGGGGSGGDSVGAGFHYDEALGVVGPVKSYKAVSYFEDIRKDLE
jgi:hypothetical protein